MPRQESASDDVLVSTCLQRVRNGLKRRLPTEAVLRILVVTPVQEGS